MATLQRALYAPTDLLKLGLFLNALHLGACKSCYVHLKALLLLSQWI
jgi:hypothetical protein